MASGAAARSSCGFLLVVTTAAFVACQSEAFSVPNNNSNTNCQSLSGNKVARSSSQLFQRRPENPITSLFSDMASSILTSGKSADFDVRGLSRKLKSVAAASWDEIRANLESKQTSEEKAFRSNVEKGIGRASPLNKIRLFDESNTEKDIRVTLYRDHASWCPYCQKVWMTLEEKKIPYRIEKVNMRCYGDKTREFLSLQPNGNIPVAVIDGEIYNQSNDIIYALEQKFPNQKALLPSNDDQTLRMKAQELLRLERSLFSAWMYWLTGGNSPRTKMEFIKTLNVVEAELQASQGGDFFLGKDVSLVDCMFAPFLERIAASMIFFKGFQIRVANGVNTDFPSINKWFDAMECLESYQLTKGDYYSHCWDLPPQLGGCTYDAPGEPFESAINGERTLDGTRGSWELPLDAHNQGVEPDWDFLDQDESAAKREAVERLSFNNKAIVSFAARGAGKKGVPPVSAPLSDPNAVPNDDVIGSVDASLKIVSQALLGGVECSSDAMVEVADLVAKEGGDSLIGDVVASLSYLRDRIGVPRDMRLPAARQLRAHLNWSIGILLEKRA